MTIRVHCPDCTWPLDVVEKLQGKKIRCPQCERVFVFTAPSEAPAKEPASLALKERPDGPRMETAPEKKKAPTPPPTANGEGPRSWGHSEERKPKESSAGNLVLILIVAAVAGLLLLGGGGMLLFVFMVRDEARSYNDVAVANQPPMMNWEKVPFDDGPDPRFDLAPIRFNPRDLPETPKPLEVRPPKLEADRITVDIEAVIHDIVVGGNGRYLVLHLPDLNQLQVFDVNQGKIAGKIPLKDPTARLAAGNDKLIVVTDDGIQRWNLTTLMLEDSAPLPFQTQIKNVAMGSASSGPLLVRFAERVGANQPGGPGAPQPGPPGAAQAGEWALLDIRNLKPIPLQGEITALGFGEANIRCSPDGKVFTFWEPGFGARMWNGGHNKTLAFLGDELKQTYSKQEGPRGDLPGNDRTIFDGRPSLAHLQQAPQGQRFFVAWSVPAHHGPYSLLLVPEEPPRNFPDAPPPPPKGLSVYRAGVPKPLASFILDVNLGRERLPERGKMTTFDKRLHFIPAAQLLVVIPNGDRELILQKFDPEEALKNMEDPLLYVASEPPLYVRPEQNYQYQVQVKSSKGGVKYKIESGPANMQINNNGLITWTPPPALAENATPVVVSIKDDGAKEIFHHFFINHPEVDPQFRGPRFNDGGWVPNRQPWPANLEAPALEKERVEIPLPAPVRDVAVGGEGRYLILHFPKLKRVSIFDVNKSKFVRDIPLPAETAHIAACMDKLVIWQSDQLIQRWDLNRLERETVAVAPVPGRVKSTAMGSASTGPLLVLSSGGNDELGNARYDLIDIDTMKTIPMRWQGDFRQPSVRDVYELRASANGQVFGAWAISLFPNGLETMVLNGNQVMCYREHNNVGMGLPSPDGQTIYTSLGMFPNSLRANQPGLNNPALPHRDRPIPIPAPHGNYYLSLDPPDAPNQVGQPEQRRPVRIYQLRNLQALGGVPDFDPRVLWDPNDRFPLATDKRIHFLPKAKVLITLPFKGDQMIVQRLDVEALQQK